MSQELTEIRDRLIRIENKLDRGSKGPVWVDKTEALRLLGCGGSKLRQLVKDGKIETNRNPKQKVLIKYKLSSINKYISNPS